VTFQLPCQTWQPATVTGPTGSPQRLTSKVAPQFQQSCSGLSEAFQSPRCLICVGGRSRVTPEVPLRVLTGHYVAWLRIMALPSGGRPIRPSITHSRRVTCPLPPSNQCDALDCTNGIDLWPRRRCPGDADLPLVPAVPMTVCAPVRRFKGEFVATLCDVR
jgi:hypothetical protein